MVYSEVRADAFSPFVRFSGDSAPMLAHSCQREKNIARQGFHNLIADLFRDFGQETNTLKQPKFMRFARAPK